MIRRRLLVEGEAGQSRREDRGEGTSARGNPQGGRTTILGLLAELNRQGTNRAGVEDVDDRAEDPSCFRSTGAANAMLDCRSVSGGELFFDEL